MMTVTKQTLPLDHQMERIQLEDIDLRFRGRLKITGNLSQTNGIFTYPGMQDFSGDLSVYFGGENNFLYIDQNCPIHGEISFPGSEAEGWIFGGIDHLRLTVGIYDKAKFVWGFNSTAFGVRAWVFDRTSLTIGPHSLFSEGIKIRTSDHHSLVDLSTMQQVNFPENIEIGKHVWVAADTSIGKGVHIGDGSVIGASSMVIKSVGKNEVWAGVPAKLLRSNTSWLANHPVTAESIQYLEAMIS